jgi:MFS transporter, DHA1 family, staphyloferrin A biosynthesis exporter
VRASPWHDMREGLRFAFTDRVARMMMLLGLIPPVLLIPSFGALMPVFAADVFRAGPEGLGVLLSAVGVGGILGGLTAAWVTRFEQTGLVQTLSLAVFAFALIAFAVSPGIGFAVFFLVIAGIAEMVHHTLYVTTLQMCAPEHMRGRMASMVPVFPAFISVGALIAGICADLIGPEFVVILFALAALAIVVRAWSRSSVLRDMRLSGLIAGAKE